MTNESLKIISLPHAQLRRPSERVRVIDESVQALVEQMIQLAQAWEKDRPHEMTVGLAAVQVDQLRKIFIVRDSFDRHQASTFRAFINPKIIKYGGVKVGQLEGCLSVPNYYAYVERYTEVKVLAYDLDGRPFRVRAKDFLARVLQHEHDHLQGVTIVDQASAGFQTEQQNFSFCRLTKTGQFEPVATEIIQQKGFFKNDA